MKKITVAKDGKVTVETINEEKSMTQQSHAEMVDINNIMRKYIQTGEITHLNTNTGTYGDFTELTDYQESLEKVLHLNNQFMELPSDIRAKFENDPQKLVDFSQDETKVQESIDLGLRIKVEPKKDETLQTLKNIEANLTKTTSDK